MILDNLIMSFKFFHISLSLFLLICLPGCKTSPNAKLDFPDGSYEGQINRDGEKHGFGIYRWIDGSVYEGEYSDDLRHGKGRFLWANGESYDGIYFKDDRTGKGVYHWPDGSFYRGDFLSGKRHGRGQFQSSNGTIYDGEWFDDLQHGHGILNQFDGRTLKGIWRKGTLLSKPAVLPVSSTKPVLSQLELEDNREEAESSISSSEKENDDSLSLPQTPSTSLTPVNLSSIEPSDPPQTLDDSWSNPPADELNIESTSDADVLISDQLEGAEDSISINAENNLKPSTTPPDWSGTVAEAKELFKTDLIDGVDVVSDRKSGIPFTGKMSIQNQQGKTQGEVNLLNGRLHGDEIFYDSEGNIVEKISWADGRQIER